MNLPERFPYTWAVAHDMLDTSNSPAIVALKSELMNYQSGYCISVTEHRIHNEHFFNISSYATGAPVASGFGLKSACRKFLRWVEVKDIPRPPPPLPKNYTWPLR